MRGAEPILIAVLTLGSLAVAGTAAGNGRTPPRPAGTAILTAICETQGGGERIEIVRPRLAGTAVPEGALELRTDAGFAPVPLDTVRALEIETTAAPGEDDAVAARLQKSGDAAAEGSPARVRVRAGADKAPIRLLGFRPDGARVELELVQCRRLEFAVAGTGPVDRPPLGPKAD